VQLSLRCVVSTAPCSCSYQAFEMAGRNLYWGNIATCTGKMYGTKLYGQSCTVRVKFVRAKCTGRNVRYKMYGQKMYGQSCMVRVKFVRAKCTGEMYGRNVRAKMYGQSCTGKVCTVRVKFARQKCTVQILPVHLFTGNLSSYHL
jgi:hypothetical protein